MCSGIVALDGPAGGRLAGTSLDMVKAMAVGMQTASKADGRSVWPGMFSGRVALDGPAGGEIGFGKACDHLKGLRPGKRQA